MPLSWPLPQRSVMESWGMLALPFFLSSSVFRSSLLCIFSDDVAATGPGVVCVRRNECRVKFPTANAAFIQTTDLKKYRNFHMFDGDAGN